LRRPSLQTSNNKETSTWHQYFAHLSSHQVFNAMKNDKHITRNNTSEGDPGNLETNHLNAARESIARGTSNNERKKREKRSDSPEQRRGSMSDESSRRRDTSSIRNSENGRLPGDDGHVSEDLNETESGWNDEENVKPL
jgi:hypothetical protein